MEFDFIPKLYTIFVLIATLKLQNAQSPLVM